MPLSPIPLSTIGHYSIDVVAKNEYTYSVQVTDLINNSTLIDLPLDPMDHTLAGVIEQRAIDALNADNATTPVLQALSKALREQIGAKEIILLPKGNTLPEYVPAQDFQKCKRLRHVNRTALETQSNAILEDYPALVKELDSLNNIAVGIKNIVEQLSKASNINPYEKIQQFLQKNGDFTDGKMAEYTREDVKGKKARCHNSNVEVISALKDKNPLNDKDVLKDENELTAFVRKLTMSSKFAYLSDETVDQNIIPLDKFSGKTVIEKAYKRGVFLLAYLASKACEVLKAQNATQDEFLMIAADGREGIYGALGLKEFDQKNNDNDYVVTMNFNKPGDVLNLIKRRILEVGFSNAQAVSKVGLMPAPAVDNINKVETQFSSDKSAVTP